MVMVFTINGNGNNATAGGEDWLDCIPLPLPLPLPVLNGNGNNATVKKRAAPFQGFNFGGFFRWRRRLVGLQAIRLSHNAASSTAERRERVCLVACLAVALLSHSVALLQNNL